MLPIDVFVLGPGFLWVLRLIDFSLHVGRRQRHKLAVHRSVRLCCVRRRRTNSKTTLGQCLVFAGFALVFFRLWNWKKCFWGNSFWVDDFESNGFESNCFESVALKAQWLCKRNSPRFVGYCTSHIHGQGVGFISEVYITNQSAQEKYTGNEWKLSEEGSIDWRDRKPHLPCRANGGWQWRSQIRCRYFPAWCEMPFTPQGFL